MYKNKSKLITFNGSLNEITGVKEHSHYNQPVLSVVIKHSLFTPNESVKSWTLCRLYLPVNNLYYFNPASNNGEDRTLIVQSSQMSNKLGKWYRNPWAPDRIRNYNSPVPWCNVSKASCVMFSYLRMKLLWAATIELSWTWTQTNLSPSWKNQPEPYSVTLKMEAEHSSQMPKNILN
jgi:hypothetical protein